MNPLPTPYDIIDIPDFSSAPSLVAWICLFLIILMLFTAYKIYSKKLNRPKLMINSYQMLKRRLIILKDSSEILKDSVLAEISIIIRSYLTFKTRIPIDTLSSRELVELARTTQVELLKPILKGLSDLEASRYQSAEKDSNQLRSLITQLLKHLEEYELASIPLESSHV